MDPINYSGSLIGLTQDPAQALLGGLKTGAAVGDLQFQAQQRELQQQALQRQQTDLATLVANPNPTAQDYANYTLRNPQAAEATKQAFGLLDESRQKQTIGVASKVYSALQAGRADLADQILEAQEQAHGNGGNPGDLESTKVLRELVKTNPQQATQMAGLFLSSAMGAKNFAGAFGAISKEARDNENAPLVQQKAQAELSDTQSKIDTRAADLEIKRADTKIKALTANIAKEGNELKKQKLQADLDSAQTKRDQLARDKSAGTESALASLDNAVDTISKLESHPGLSGNLGKTGVIPNIPGSDSSNAAALIEQLQSQTFLGSIQSMKGMGALSDAEGAKLNNAIASLNTKQSEPQFRAQLASIKQLFEKGRERAAKQAGTTIAPREGVIMTHPTYGPITNERIDAIAAKAGLNADQKAELMTRLQQGGQ